MIALNSYSPQAQTRVNFIKNSLKQPIYFRENLRKNHGKITSIDEKSNSFVKPYASLPKENSLRKTQFKLQPFQAIIRSKTEASMLQNAAKTKKPKHLPPKCAEITLSNSSKRRMKDPTLKLLAKTLVFRKSHKYYIYSKNKSTNQQINPQKHSSIQTNLKKGSLLLQRQLQDKIMDSKLRKKYKLLELNGCKINLQDFTSNQSFNNSSIYLQSNSECYFG